MFSTLTDALNAFGRGNGFGADDFAEKAVYQTGASTPTVTPKFIGQLYLDTTNQQWYRSTSLESSSWVKTSDNTGRINVKDYGAYGDDSTDDTSAINAAIAATPTGGILYFPVGKFLVSATINIPSKRIYIQMDGYISPYPGFDDYLLSFAVDTVDTIVADFQGNINSHSIRLDCKWLSRGMKAVQVDDSHFNCIEIYRPYGTGIKLSNVRECNFINPRIISGLYRERFSEPSAWSSGASYVVGDKIKRVYTAWSGGTTYAKNDYVLGSDGITYRSLAGSNTNHDPTTDNTWWVWEPTLYFECLINNSNKDPITYNTGDSTAGNRYWQRVFKDESGLDLNQDETTNDGSNSCDFIGLIVRNCDYSTLVRLDTNLGMASSVNTIRFFGGHIHHIGDSYVTQEAVNSGVAFTVRDNTHCVEIYRARMNCFFGTTLRQGDSGRGVIVRLGNSLDHALSDRNRFIGCACTGDAAGQCGFVGGEYFYQPNTTYLLANYLELTGADARSYVGCTGDVPSGQIRVLTGAGSPESVVAAPVGCLYLRSDGGAVTTLYVKESGTNNTGWVAK